MPPKREVKMSDEPSAKLLMEVFEKKFFMLYDIQQEMNKKSDKKFELLITKLKQTKEDIKNTQIRLDKIGSSLQSVICTNDSLFYFIFFYPFPIFGILIITILLVRFKSRNSSKNSEGKNGVPLLWIKEPHLNYSPTCLEPPVLSIHPGTID